MFSVRTCWGLLAFGVLALAPVTARAGDDTFRLTLPGGQAADQGATTRTLALMPGDEADTELVFHRCHGGCLFGGCGFRSCWGGCGYWGGCFRPHCYAGFYSAPAYCYSAPVVAYCMPAYEYTYLAPPVSVVAPAYAYRAPAVAAPAYAYRAPAVAAPVYAYRAPAISYGVRVANAGVSVNLGERTVRLEIPALGSTTLTAPTVAQTYRAAPAPVRETLPAPTATVPYSAPAQAVPADGTFQYDGGPAAPVPMPREVVPAPAAPPVPAAPTTGAATRVVSGQPSSKFVYPAYGEQPRKVTEDAGRRVARQP